MPSSAGKKKTALDSAIDDLQRRNDKPGRGQNLGGSNTRPLQFAVENKRDLRLDLRLYFFFNDTAPTEIYTLSLHDALPILLRHAMAAYGVLLDPSLPLSRRQ